MHNVDSGTIRGFGLQWQDFDQAPVPSSELEEVFLQVFRSLSLGHDKSGQHRTGCGMRIRAVGSVRRPSGEKTGLR